MPPNDTNHGDFIKKNFMSIWPIHLAAFTRLMTQLRERFDGDLDLLLVLAVIGGRTRPEKWMPELLTYRQLVLTKGEEHLQYPINIQSIADYSGIPRETVRRKVTVLQDKGWITRDVRGHLAVSRDAATDLEEATRDTITYLSAILEAFDNARSNKTGSR